jgi:hypothetical protein
LSVTGGKAKIEALHTVSAPSTPATFVIDLLAAQFGNPVPDGAPVVFQTNMGSIGSSSKGACSTVNGGCSVDFRSQDPRTHAANTPFTPCNNYGAGGTGMNDSTRPGLATICASTTDGTNTLFKKLAIFFSGSTAANVYLVGTGTRLSGLTDLGTVGATDSAVFQLLISDVNQNPMPVGTTVNIVNVTNGTAVGVAPQTVQNIFPHGPLGDDMTGNTVSGNQGSYHTITIASAQPKPCVTPLVSNFGVNITTLGQGSVAGTTTTYPFKVTFSCP